MDDAGHLKDDLYDNFLSATDRRSDDAGHLKDDLYDNFLSATDRRSDDAGSLRIFYHEPHERRQDMSYKFVMLVWFVVNFLIVKESDVRNSSVTIHHLTKTKILG